MKASWRTLAVLAGAIVLLNNAVGVLLGVAGASPGFNSPVVAPAVQDHPARTDALFEAMEHLNATLATLAERLSGLEYGYLVNAGSEHARNDTAYVEPPPWMGIANNGHGTDSSTGSGPLSTVEQGADRVKPIMEVVNPTPEQQSIFLSLKARFNDPAYVWSLRLDELIQSDELGRLPAPLQRVIIDRAIDLFNNGAIDPQGFVVGMPVGE